MSRIFNSVVETIEQNKSIKESGGIIAIPWEDGFPRLSTVIPGVRKGLYTIITSGTKESKTQLCDFLFVYQPIDWLLKNPHVKIKYKVLYFLLELSKEAKILQAICYRLFTHYNILINPDNLLSVFKDYTIDEHILNIIKSDEFKKWMDFFEDTVVFYDNIKHPTGIGIVVDKYARENGKIYYREVDDWERPGYKRKVFDRYEPNDPDEIVVPIYDHASLLSEKGKTTYECIKDLSSDLSIKFKNRYGYSPVLIQQQSADATKQQFTSKGSSILEKVKPTREGLANNKDTAMDCSLMIGIFSPYKYEEPEYENWDLTRLRDGHREISILLNRHGRSNITVQAYFNGACNFFKELPRLPSENVYRFAERLRDEEDRYTRH